MFLKLDNQVPYDVQRYLYAFLFEKNRQIFQYNLTIDIYQNRFLILNSIYQKFRFHHTAKCPILDRQTLRRVDFRDLNVDFEPYALLHWCATFEFCEHFNTFFLLLKTENIWLSSIKKKRYYIIFWASTTSLAKVMSENLSIRC